MAHFAEIRSEDNRVLRVVVVSNDDVANNGGEYSSESETWAANNIPNDETLGLDPYPETYWKQTSYNTKGGVHYQEDGSESADQSKAKRLNYAGRHSIYDVEGDYFYNMKPYDSWTWNSETKDWQAPVAMPTDRPVKWNEVDQQWEDF